MRQDISAKPYSKFITLECNDDKADVIIDALDIIWLHPSGQGIIERAMTVHNKPVLITDDDTSINGYLTTSLDYIYNHPEFSRKDDPHRININFSVLEGSTYMGTDNVQHPLSVLRIVSHELYHASDEFGLFSNDNGMFDDLTEQYADVDSMKETAAHIQFFLSYFDADDLDKDDDVIALEAEKLYQDPEIQAAYDKHIDSIIDQYQEVYYGNNYIREYVTLRETPAINFENDITKGREVPRNNAYVDHSLEDMEFWRSKEGFIKSAQKTFQFARKYGGSDNLIATLSTQIELLEQDIKAQVSPSLNPDYMVRQTEFQGPLASVCVHQREC